MKTPQIEANNPMSWIIKKKKSILMQGEATIAAMKIIRRRRAVFTIGDEKYSIRNRGFWNPVTIVVKGNEKILELTRDFSGRRPVIRLAGGNRYLIRIRNAVFASIVITDLNKNDIIRYRLLSKTKAVIRTKADPGKDDLLIIILGYFIFRGIIAENKSIDPGKIIFRGIVIQPK